MTIIERILDTAEKKGIKQVDIAKLINKGTAQITSWKQRGCNPPAEYIPAIAELLGVTVGWLMTGKEETEIILPEQEQQLLDYYHTADKKGQELILEHAEYIATKHPKLDGRLSEYKIG